MNLPTEIFGDVVIVHAPEELSEDVVEQFVGFVSKLNRRKVIVDLDSSELLDSAGLTALLDLQDSMRQEEGDLKLIARNAVNRKILEITRLDQQLDVFDSVIEAVKSFV